MLAGLQNGQRGYNGHEDAGEEVAHLEDGEPLELVGLPEAPGRELE